MKSRGRSSKRKIPLAPVIGGIVTGYMALSKIARFAGDTAYSSPGAALNDLAMATIGMSKDGSGKYAFSWETLMNGLLPDFIPLGIGVGAHIVASKTGANRAIAAVPWFSI